MKKAFSLALLLAAAGAAHAQNTAGLEKWIAGFPAGQTALFGFRITQCAVERTGALVVIDRAGTPVRLNILKQAALDDLREKLASVERILFDDAALRTENWNIAFGGCEIDFGLQDEITVTARVSSFRFRLIADTILDLTGRLEADPVFTRRRQDKAFTYTLRFRGVAAGTDQREAFPGWDGCVRRLASWFEQGLREKNQAVQALVIDTKVMSMSDRQAQKRVVLSKEDKGNLWFGVNIDYAMANVIEGEPYGVYLNPVAYHQIRSLAYYSWRGLGDETWIARPYQITLSFGGFVEFNGSYLTRSAEFDAYQGVFGSFLLAGGPCVGVEIAAMVPRIVSDQHQGDILGLGAELLVAFNVPYLFPGYHYEYFLFTSLSLVIHLIPVNGWGLDLLAGFQLALATDLYDVTLGGLMVSQHGFTLGARLKIDTFNFFKSDRMFE